MTHLTRPKSSKGRSRPAVSTPPRTGDPDSTQGRLSPPHSPGHGRDTRPQPQPALRQQAGQLSRDDGLPTLRRPPAAPPQSLNRYTVLPSIGGRRPQRDAAMTASLHGHGQGGADPPAGQAQPGLRPEPPDPEARATGGRLLLAIRAPCGSRFERLFEPTDTVQAVRASAELRFGAEYGDAAVETVEVPRRTLADMGMTLAQCGIFNRSLLCITYKDPELT